MENISIKKNFLVFILINIFFVSFYLFTKHSVANDSSISEWLINYQGGFTRRGLGGEIVIFFARLFEITLRQSIMIVQLTIHTLYLVLVYHYIKKIKINLIQLFALYTPIFLLYPIAELEVLGRKEMLLFLFFILFLFFSTQKFHKSIINSQVFFIAPLVCLIWEQFVLFFPFIAVVLIFKNNLKTFKESFQKLLIIFLPSILTFMYIFFNPMSLEEHKLMCEFLESEFRESCYMSASMLVTSTIHFDTLWVHNNANFEHYFRYVMIFIIGFLPINILVSNDYFKKQNNFITNNFKLKTVFFILYSPSLFLFGFGYDWGRWINITYTFSILLYFYFLKNFFINNEVVIKNPFWNKIIRKKITLGLIFFIFAFGWNPKTVITGDVATKPFYQIPRKAIKILYYKFIKN